MKIFIIVNAAADHR